MIGGWVCASAIFKINSIVVAEKNFGYATRRLVQTAKHWKMHWSKDSEGEHVLWPRWILVQQSRRTTVQHMYIHVTSSWQVLVFFSNPVHQTAPQSALVTRLCQFLLKMMCTWRSSQPRSRTMRLSLTYMRFLFGHVDRPSFFSDHLQSWFWYWSWMIPCAQLGRVLTSYKRIVALIMIQHWNLNQSHPY